MKVQVGHEKALVFIQDWTIIYLTAKLNL